MESYLPQKKKAKIFKFAPALSGNKHLRVAASFREKETTHWAGTKKGCAAAFAAHPKKIPFCCDFAFSRPRLHPALQLAVAGLLLHMGGEVLRGLHAAHGLVEGLALHRGVGGDVQGLGPQLAGGVLRQLE